MGLVSFLEKSKIYVVCPATGSLVLFSKWGSSYEAFTPYVRELALFTPEGKFRFSLKTFSNCTYSKATETASFHSCFLPTVSQCIILRKCLISGFLKDALFKFCPNGFEIKGPLWTRDLDCDEEVYPNIGFVFYPDGSLQPCCVDEWFACLEVKDIK